EEHPATPELEQRRAGHGAGRGRDVEGDDAAGAPFGGEDAVELGGDKAQARHVEPGDRARQLPCLPTVDADRELARLSVEAAGVERIDDERSDVLRGGDGLPGR